MKKLNILLITLATVSFTGNGLATADHSSKALIAFVFKIANVKGMLHEKISTNPSFDPEAQQFLASVVNDIDSEKLVDLFTTAVDGAFSSDDLQKCVSMVNADVIIKAGDLVSNTVGSKESADIWSRDLNKAEQKQLIEYLDSDCFTKTTEIMANAENQEKLLAYSRNFVCSAVASKRPELLTKNAFLKTKCEGNLTESMTSK